jgi:uncharacterized protein
MERSVGPFVVDTRRAQRNAGTPEPFEVSGLLAVEGEPGVMPDAETPVVCVGTLQALSDGSIVVNADATGAWIGQCRRCLRSLSEPLSVHLSELFEASPEEGETYQLGDQTIDLEQAVRDNFILEMPVLTLCSEECEGICPECGADRNEAPCGCTVERLDPRWDALKDFDFS